MSHTTGPSEYVPYTTTESLGTRVLKSSALQVFGRLLFRVLKFGRTIVVAHLLFPEDIGLFVLASLCLGFADVFIQTGFQSALVERRNLERKHLDGAWTVHVVKGIVLASIAFFLAPYVAGFFNEPNIIPVLRALSILLALDGFVNTGVILLQRDLQFGKKLMYDFSYIVAEILGVIIAAQFIQNVWALVIGALIGQVAALLFSYVFHSYRPRFTVDFSGARELFQFGKWVSLTGIVTFFVSKGDGIAIGKFLSVTDLGYYQVAFSLALLPGVEIVRSLSSVFFPFFVQLKEKGTEIGTSFVKIARTVSLIVFPAIVGLYAIDTLVVTTLYGEKWLPIVPVLHILILYGGLKSIEYFITPVLLGTGNPKIGTYATSIYGVILLVVLVPGTVRYGIEGVAWSLVVACSVSTVYILLFSSKILKINFRQVLSIIVVPCCASALMYAGILFTQEHIINVLATSLVVGFIVYTSSVFLLDRYTGNHVRSALFWIRQNLHS